MDKSSTKRVTVPEIDDLLGERMDVLDHGFVRVVDYMGSDSAVVQAARVSYGEGTKHLSQDAALINYLISHGHTTPFEMCEIKLHVKLPIFVARQWVRHRTANINEYSARYSISSREFYLPKPDQIAKQSTNNAQGRSELLDPDSADSTIAKFRDHAGAAYDIYEDLLSQDLSRELARAVLPVNYYTEWYWKIDLHNLLHFLKLRVDRHAQHEIRVYAEVILAVVRKWVPLTYSAFMEHVVEAETISKRSQEVVRRLVGGEEVEFENSGLTKREWGKLMLMVGKRFT